MSFTGSSMSNTICLDAPSPAPYLYRMPEWFRDAMPGLLRDYALGIALTFTGAIGTGLLWIFRKSIWPKLFARVKLRRVVRAIPELRSGDRAHTSNWHTWELHHDAGEPFQIDGCFLVILVPASSTGIDQPSAESQQPEIIPYTLMEPLTKQPRPLLKPGNTFYFAAALPISNQWDAVDTTERFAQIIVTSQRKMIQSWDVSDELRPAMPRLREWSRSSSPPPTCAPPLVRAILPKTGENGRNLIP